MQLDKIAGLLLKKTTKISQINVLFVLQDKDNNQVMTLDNNITELLQFIQILLTIKTADLKIHWPCFGNFYNFVISWWPASKSH